MPRVEEVRARAYLPPRACSAPASALAEAVVDAVRLSFQTCAGKEHGPDAGSIPGVRITSSMTGL